MHDGPVHSNHATPVQKTQGSLVKHRAYRPNPAAARKTRRGQVSGHTSTPLHGWRARGERCRALARGSSHLVHAQPPQAPERRASVNIPIRREGPQRPGA